MTKNEIAHKLSLLSRSQKEVINNVINILLERKRI